MRKQTADEERVMNKIIRKGLLDENGVKPAIKAIFDSLGIEVLKTVRQNGEHFTKAGDQLLIAGPKPTMDALLHIFPKGFANNEHCPLAE